MTDDGRDDGVAVESAEAGDEQDGFEWAMSVDDVEGRGPLEPGSVDPEHALFVLLGGIVTLFVLVRLLGL